MTRHTRRLSRDTRPWRLGPRAWRGHRRAGISWIALTIGAAVLLLVGVVIYCSRVTSGSGPDLAAAETLPTGQDVALPVSTFADGRARFYTYVTGAGHETRFFVIKSSDGVVRAAFDACDSCFRNRRGFRQAGDHLICNWCGRAFMSQHVNVLKGGCSPAPLERTVEGDRVVVQAAALEQGASYF